VNKRNTHEAGKKKRKYPELVKDKNKIKLREGKREEHSTGTLQGGGEREGRTELGQSKHTGQRAKHLEKGRWRRGG